MVFILKFELIHKKIQKFLYKALEILQINEMLEQFQFTKNKL